MTMTVNPAGPGEGLADLYDELAETADAICTLFQQCSVEYARTHLLSETGAHQQIKISGLSHVSEMHLPYFVSREKARI